MIKPETHEEYVDFYFQHKEKQLEMKFDMVVIITAMSMCLISVVGLFLLM